jgi:hypothetical protein
MATPNQPTDPAQLGADQSPETSPRDDAHDMSPVLAEADKDQSPDTTRQQHGQALGSDFDQQRRQGAEGHGNPTGETSQGQGRTDNGDEDRTYDQNSQRGGLGSSGGREDHTDRHTDTNANPYTGGTHQPSAEQTHNLGLNTPSPTDKPAQ